MRKEKNPRDQLSKRVSAGSGSLSSVTTHSKTSTLSRQSADYTRGGCPSTDGGSNQAWLPDSVK